MIIFNLMLTQHISVMLAGYYCFFALWICYWKLYF